jgi:molybdopterin-guanine dinucleotide biosynthesis protein A
MHHKHPPITRPSGDHYARTDVALVGSTCAIMDGLIRSWAEVLHPDFRTLSVIGDHGDPVEGTLLQLGGKRFQTPADHWNDYDERLQRSHYDLALINGNHYPAERQIVFVDPAKADTLERRREQLTDVMAVVLCPDAETMPDWLSAELENMAAPVVCQLEEATLSVLPLLNNLLRTRVPALKSLILLGGRSQRMGARKADLIYRNGQSEAERLADICDQVTPGQVYFSVADASASTPTAYPIVVDRFLELGPAGAIASAFLHDPNAAWLVLACDLPLLELDVVKKLVRKRSSARYATAYRRPGERFPEPLVAIYEPRAYERLLRMLSMGYACPRKLLINSDVKVIDATDDRPFTNANTPEERERVLELLQAEA